MTGQPGPGHGKKLGHRGVDASGETTYKKVPALPSVLGWDEGPLCLHPPYSNRPAEGRVCAVAVSGWRRLLSVLPKLLVQVILVLTGSEFWPHSCLWPWA